MHVSLEIRLHQSIISRRPIDVLAEISVKGFTTQENISVILRNHVCLHHGGTVPVSRLTCTVLVVTSID